jgi:hypothetical protein
MTAQYNYLVTDLASGMVLGELPVNNVALDCQLNSAGNMSAGCRLSDKRIDDDELIARTVPGKTAFWAYRENQIAWGGIILSREYQSNGKAMSLTGQTFECYAARRFPRSVIGVNVQNLSMGQSAMINYLWNQMQSIAGGSIGVQVGSAPPVDPNTTLTINGYDLSTSYNDLITSITELTGGPDWTIAWGEDGNGLPYPFLVVGAPIGNPIGFADLEVDYPGPIMDYTYTENSSSGNNWWWATGDGTGATQTTGSAVDENSLNSGYPIWEGVNNYSGVTVQATINSHAASDLAALPVPLITHAVDLVGNAFPMFGSYGMGDYMVANIVDPRFKVGETFEVRAIGWSIQPPDEGNGTEQISIVFDEATGSGGD